MHSLGHPFSTHRSSNHVADRLTHPERMVSIDRAGQWHAIEVCKRQFILIYDGFFRPS